MGIQLTTNQTPHAKYFDYYYNTNMQPQQQDIGALTTTGLSDKMVSYSDGVSGTPCINVPVQFDSSANPIFDKSTFGHFKATLKKDGTCVVSDKPNGWDDLSVKHLCEWFVLCAAERGKTTGYVKYASGSGSYSTWLYPVPFYTNNEIVVEATASVFAPIYKPVSCTTSYTNTSNIIKTKVQYPATGHNASWIGPLQYLATVNSGSWLSAPQIAENTHRDDFNIEAEKAWAQAQADFAREANCTVHSHNTFRGMRNIKDLRNQNSASTKDTAFGGFVSAACDYTVSITCANEVVAGFWDTGLGWTDAQTRYNAQKMANYTGESIRGSHVIGTPMCGWIYCPTVTCELVLDIPLNTNEYGMILNDTTVKYTVYAYIGNKVIGLYREQTINHIANTYPVNPYDTYPDITDTTVSFPNIVPNTNPSTFTNTGTIKLTPNSTFTSCTYQVNLRQGDVPAYDGGWTFTYEFVVTDSSDNVKASKTLSTKTPTAQLGQVSFSGTFAMLGINDANRYSASLVVKVWYNNILIKQNVVANTVAVSHDVIELIGAIDGIGFFDTPRANTVAVSKLNLREEYDSDKLFCIRDGFFGTTNGMLGHVVTLYFSTGYKQGSLVTYVYVGCDSFGVAKAAPVQQINNSGWSGQLGITAMQQLILPDGITTTKPKIDYSGVLISTNLDAEFRLPIYSFATGTIIGYVTDANIVPARTMLTTQTLKTAASWPSRVWASGAENYLVSV